MNVYVVSLKYIFFKFGSEKVSENYRNPEKISEILGSTSNTHESMIIILLLSTQDYRAIRELTSDIGK